MQFNPAENYLQNSLYESYLANFSYKEIGKKLNISFDDYINRPRHEIESMNRVIDQTDAKKIAANKALLADIESAKNASKKPLTE